METKANINLDLGGLAIILTVVFIVLKLVGVIDWSWWWVLAPLWIALALCILAVLITAIVYAIVDRI